MIALAALLVLAVASPKAPASANVEEPSSPPAGYFVEQPKRNRWCSFASRKAAEQFQRSQGDFEPQDAPGVAWARLKAGKLDSVTVHNQSADAFSDDRYFFDPAGRISEVRRTGSYDGRPMALTFVLRPDPNGRLSLTAQSRALRDRVSEKEIPTYWLEWDLYKTLSDLPFIALMPVESGKVIVRPGCTTPPKDRIKPR